MEDITLAIMEAWEKIGITGNVQVHNVMAVYGDIVQRKTNGVCFGWSADNQGPPYGTLYATGGVYYGGTTIFPMYQNTELDALIEAREAASTIEDKDDYLEQITQFLYDEYAVVPLVSLDRLWLTGDSVDGFHPVSFCNPGLEYVTHSPALGTFRLFEP